MSIEDYYNLLVGFDWYYEYSDDHRVWTRGKEESRKIQAIAQEDTVVSRMYSEYAHYISNPKYERKPLLEDYTAGVAQR